MEKMASQIYSDKKIKGPGIQDVLNHFNSFENHDTWCINEGQADEGFGLQLVIVWDGDIPEAQTQVLTLPKMPVKKIKVPVTPSKEEDDLEIPPMEEEDVLKVEVAQSCL